MVPLTGYSHFSLMWGTASPAELCQDARKKGYTRLALTDRDNLYGLWPFLRACEQAGITPIVGAELSDPKSKKVLSALVETDEGYQNLCHLISQRHLDPDFDLQAAVLAHRPGLLFLVTDAGLLRALHAAGANVAAAMPCRPNSHTAGAREAARELNVPLVATPGSVFLHPGDYAVHRLLRAIEANTSLSRLDAGTLAPPEAFLATPEEYARRFEVFPEAVAASELLADRCSFTGPRHGTVMPPWLDASGQNADAVLRQAAYAGARRRYGDDLSETVVDRLEKELRLITAKGFSSYFLVVQNIIQRSPRICGRGSGAASLVAYALGITNVCPIKHNLYFERFLNPGRMDPPDIDVDFAWDERDAVLQSVFEQYPGRSAMVCNHVCFQPRMAIREVAKVYGLTDREIGQVSKRLPWLWHDEEPGQDLQSRLETLPELKTLDFPQPWPEILALAQKIMGAPRYISVHSGGVVITPRLIQDYVPVERAPKGVPILQWEKDGTEDSGLVKIDLLGNRSLGVIRDALANIRANAIAFDESHWEPENDLATQQALALGKTMGCFYIESPAMRLLQQKTGVGDFEHLVIHSSIIRPAANDYIREYVRRLKGGDWEPIHPLMADVLDETFGIMVYQEDVSKTAIALAGFSHAEADGLRKILGKKNRAQHLRDYQERFFAGAQARDVSPERIQAVWAMMLSFEGYSFCKPHSASYARVSFQAAYLKVHFPAEFMAAVISNQGGFYSAFAYVSEARRLGLTVLHPDVNESEIRWQGCGRIVRIGLLSIQSLGTETQARILAERKKQRFLRFDEFLDRVEPDLEEGRALIHSGACDSLAPGQDRAALLWALAAWHAQRSKAAKSRPALELFATVSNLTLPPIPAGKEIDQLRLEFKVLGFLCDRHPMTLFSALLPRHGLVKAAELSRHIGYRVRMAGWLITGKVVPTKKDEPMEFITFEDETGLVETTFFPKVYHQFCDQLVWNRPYLLTGTVDEDYGAITLTVDRAQALRG
jgi:DNA polymerase-3 subunit alpha/error-prone DNA polymerase